MYYIRFRVLFGIYSVNVDFHVFHVQITWQEYLHVRLFTHFVLFRVISLIIPSLITFIYFELDFCLSD